MSASENGFAFGAVCYGGEALLLLIDLATCALWLEPLGVGQISHSRLLLVT